MATVAERQKRRMKITFTHEVGRRRRRVYALHASQWTTRDLLWPKERAYGHGNGNSVRWVDPNERPHFGQGNECNCG